MYARVASPASSRDAPLFCSTLPLVVLFLAKAQSASLFTPSRKAGKGSSAEIESNWIELNWIESNWIESNWILSLLSVTEIEFNWIGVTASQPAPPLNHPPLTALSPCSSQTASQPAPPLHPPLAETTREIGAQPPPERRLPQSARPTSLHSNVIRLKSIQFELVSSHSIEINSVQTSLVTFD